MQRTVDVENEREGLSIVELMVEAGNEGCIVGPTVEI